MFNRNCWLRESQYGSRWFAGIAGYKPMQVMFLNSVFCKNRGYNRKNLYLCVLLVVIFCMAVKVDTRKEIIFGSSDPNVR